MSWGRWVECGGGEVQSELGKVSGVWGEEVQSELGKVGGVCEVWRTWGRCRVSWGR